MAFDLAGFLDEFGALAVAKGFAQRTLCDTPAGPLVIWERANDEPAAYLSGGMHGDEPAGALAVLELLKQGAFDSGAWRLCPAVNPTGLAAGTRHNSDGIDLNRDYLSRGTAEVQAHAAWLESLPYPHLFISLHEDWESTGFYFYEINLGGDRPDRARVILDAVEPWFSREPADLIDGHGIREKGWIYHPAEADFPNDWPEAIFLAKLGCPVSFTFETPSANCLEDRIAAHVAAVKAAIRFAAES